MTKNKENDFKMIVISIRKIGVFSALDKEEMIRHLKHILNFNLKQREELPIEVEFKFHYASQ